MLRISIAFGAIFHNKSFFQFSSVHNNKTTYYANSFVIISTSCKYILCKMHNIVITHSSYAISYIKILNGLCVFTKRLYTFPHL